MDMAVLVMASSQTLVDGDVYVSIKVLWLPGGLMVSPRCASIVFLLLCWLLWLLGSVLCQPVWAYGLAVGHELWDEQVLCHTLGAMPYVLHSLNNMYQKFYSPTGYHPHE